ncbi:MAG: gamma-glutamyl-gamma-aminobutyrate hydrolase family protein [candidate division Zixibacteria bacterium]|nr:gamma-glutamyl-gamma-aminobutyrate hydrolase family protein [candidate division Zixibacteria bacterium]
MNKSAKIPIIGITCSMEHQDKTRAYPTAYAFDYMKRNYYHAVERSGGVAVLLPNTEIRGLVSNYLKLVDGLLISGGNDVDPAFYRERKKAKNLSITRERDAFEIVLVKRAKEKGVPVLAICRGMQLVNVAFGGSLYQDFRFEKKFLDHTLEGSGTCKKKHPVIVQENSRLFRIIQKSKIMVNTSHHQMVKRVAPGFVATAWSEKDGVIEAIEPKDKNSPMCVQWHPELMRDDGSKALFDWLIESAGECKIKKLGSG